MFNGRLTKKAILKSNDAHEFYQSKCCITISVGQRYHEDDMFKATLESINNSFQRCTIVMGDSLQRHTMKILSPLSKDEIYVQANLLGDQWLERNLFDIEKLKIPYQISRWDYWINHPVYNNKYNIINELYLNDPLFKVSVDTTANFFLDRNQDKIIVEREEAFHLSKEYLIEECAGMLLLADDAYHFDVYPNKRNLAIDYVYRKIVSEVNTKLIRAVSIKFKSKIPEMAYS